MTDLMMPKLGLTMTEGLLAEWRVAAGASFVAGDVLFVVETEKIANEIEAQEAGRIETFLVDEGETVPVGTPVARLSEAPTHAVSNRDVLSEGAARVETAPPKEDLESKASRSAPPERNRVPATPLARRLARQHNIDLRDLTGSGPRGRIKAADVERATADRAASPVQVPEGPSQAHLETPDAARMATARRVSAAKRDIPHFYVQAEAEVSELLELRAKLNGDPRFARLSVSHLLIKAIGQALAELPETNRIWLDEGLLSLGSTDVGLVVDTDAGLRVPVIRNVAARPLDAVAQEAGDKAGRARDETLTPQDMSGGAISLSNVGMHDVSGLIPIVNPPQSMILGVGAERGLFRPDADGNPVLRREITLWLACDHRVLDGALAARFLACLTTALEVPLALLRPVPQGPQNA